MIPDNDLGEDEGDEYSIAHRVLTRRRSVLDPNQSCCQDQLSSSIVLPQPQHKNQADIFINNLITLVSKIAPNDVFSMKKSKRSKFRRMMKKIHPELRNVFKFSPDLFSPTPVARVSDVRPPVPVVDWTKVNQKGMGNLPQPQMFPKLGCSDDLNIYAERTHDRGYHGIIKSGSIHEKEPYPFGLEYGLMTDLGVISCNKGDQMTDPYLNIIHGHVWSRDLQRWVIHARYPKDNAHRAKKDVAKEASAAAFKKPKRKRELC